PKPAIATFKTCLSAGAASAGNVGFCTAPVAAVGAVVGAAAAVVGVAAAGAVVGAGAVVFAGAGVLAGAVVGVAGAPQATNSAPASISTSTILRFDILSSVATHCAS